MARERLTVERIKRFACPSGSAQAFLWDQDVRHLAVRATANGSKAFIYEGKLDRKTVRITIGKASDWILSDARAEARRLQTLIDRGIDPREQERARKQERDDQKAAAEAKQNYTLKALLAAYTDHLEAQGKARSARSARSAVKVHVLEADPALSEKPATDITPHNVADLIRQAREKGKERTSGVLRSVLNAAFNCGRRAPFDTQLPSIFIKFNITSNPVDVIPTIAVKAGNRTLSKEELKQYISALGETTIDMALKLALFSGGQRMAQILRAEVGDWDGKILRLTDPKGKRKQPREHLLPLGPMASGVVAEQVKRAQAAGVRWIFPSRAGTPLHESMPGPRVTEIAQAMGGEPFDLRDLRRTVETMLAGVGVSREIRAQLLSHGISGVQALHYDRHDYLKEKRGALLRWERHLTRIMSGEEEKKIIHIGTLQS